MAKKKPKVQKTKPKKELRLALSYAEGGLLLLATILFANCSGDGGGTPAISVDQ